MKKIISIMLSLTIWALFIPIAKAETSVAEELITVSVTAEDLGFGLPQEGYFLPENNSAVLSDGTDAEYEQVIVEGLKNKAESIDISKFNYVFSEATKADFAAQYYEIVTDNPELYYVRTAYRISYSGTSKVIKTIKPQYLLESEYDDELFWESVNEIADKTVTDGMTDEEIVLSVHDYLVDYITYYQNYTSSSAPDTIYSAYGAIVNKSAVCQGYSLAFKVILDLFDIESEYVDSNSMNHGWNLVKLGKNWYHIDLTWADSYETNYPNDTLVSHRYFLRSDNYFETHDRVHYDWNNDSIVCIDTIYDSTTYSFNDDYAGIGRYTYRSGYFYIKNTFHKLYAKTKFDGSEYQVISEREYDAAIEAPIAIPTPDPPDTPTDAPDTVPAIADVAVENAKTVVTLVNIDKGTVIAVEFENGVLKDIEIVDVSTDIETVASKKITIEGIEADRVYVWDSLTAMTPLSDFYDMKIDG